IVERTQAWFDARPFDGQPQSPNAHIRCQIEVSLRVLPPVAGCPRALAMLDAPDLLLPGPPIVVGAVAFHLMGRYRDSPGEIGGEVEGRFWSWHRLEHLLGLRGQTGCGCAPGFDGQLWLQEYVAHTPIWSGL